MRDLATEVVLAEWRGLNAALVALSSFDVEGLTPGQVRLGIYHLIMNIKPPLDTRRLEAADDSRDP